MPVTEAELAQFTGSTICYADWTNTLRYTEGVRFLAEHARAFWLIDLIASHQRVLVKDSGLAEFQLWELRVDVSRAVAICFRDTDDEILRQEIPFTDFPLPRVRLYVEGGVLLLPTEH
jgi:hypothetical protein